VTAAIRSSWKAKKLPDEREQLHYLPFFYDADADKLQLGHIPTSMDDKWFIFYEEGWLYFHRSWTGNCIYWLRLDGSPGGVRTLESWVCRNKRHYDFVDSQSDIDVLDMLFRKVLKVSPVVD
jgi:hypothetical protein